MTHIPTAHERWWWERLLELLDQAGYRLVQKPTLKDKGKTKGGLRGGSH